MEFWSKEDKRYRRMLHDSVGTRYIRRYEMPAGATIDSYSISIGDSIPGITGSVITSLSPAIVTASAWFVDVDAVVPRTISGAESNAGFTETYRSKASGKSGPYENEGKTWFVRKGYVAAGGEMALQAAYWWTNYPYNAEDPRACDKIDFEPNWLPGLTGVTLYYGYYNAKLRIFRQEPPRDPSKARVFVRWRDAPTMPTVEPSGDRRVILGVDPDNKCQWKARGYPTRCAEIHIQTAAPISTYREIDQLSVWGKTNSSTISFLGAQAETLLFYGSANEEYVATEEMIYLEWVCLWAPEGWNSVQSIKSNFTAKRYPVYQTDGTPYTDDSGAQAYRYVGSLEPVADEQWQARRPHESTTFSLLAGLVKW